MTPLDLILLALFAWYTSYVLIRTSGPFGLFARVRGVTTVGGLLECQYCLVVWMAALGYLVMGKPLVPEMAVWIGAAAGLGMLGHRWTGGDHI